MLQLFALLIRVLTGKTISALLPNEQRQANLLDGKPFDVGEVQVPRAGYILVVLHFLTWTRSQIHWCCRLNPPGLNNARK